MKILIVSGDDYCALEFEQHFSGKCIRELIDRFDAVSAEFKTLRDDACLKVVEGHCGDEVLLELRDVWGDYDAMKTSNAYPENTTLS
jgi:hypothetical protein